MAGGRESTVSIERLNELKRAVGAIRGPLVEKYGAVQRDEVIALIDASIEYEAANAATEPDAADSTLPLEATEKAERRKPKAR